MMRTSRIAILDIVRVITAYLVIFGHLLPKGDIRSFIYLFHMPLFFFVSGILYKQEDFKIVLIKSLKGIIIPLISFMIIPAIFSSLYLGIEESFKFFKWSISGFVNSGPIFTNWVLWFLVVLFNTKLIANVVLRINPIVWPFIWILGYWIFGKYNYFFGASTMMALPFFIMGYYSKNYIVSFPSISKNKILLISILALLIMFCIYKINGNVSINICKYGSFSNIIIRILFFYIGAICGIFVIFAISSLIKDNNFFTNSAKALITIMCAQYMFIDLIEPISNNVNLLGKGVISLIIMLLCCYVHKIIIKYIPQILGKF